MACLRDVIVNTVRKGIKRMMMMIMIIIIIIIIIFYWL